ncbi:MAG: DUF721 domain-containing protein [Candidatus Omnitrophica bacterium]|nr:DUF721 domain-containing protein [Candidatus Omnitrophota bacterium]
MSRKLKDKKVGFTKVEKVVRGIIKTLESPQKLQEAYLFELWNNLVDPEVKKRASPERLYGKTLYVKVKEPMWAHEMTLNHRTRILEILQREVGKENLNDIRFHAGNTFNRET